MEYINFLFSNWVIWLLLTFYIMFLPKAFMITKRATASTHSKFVLLSVVIRFVFTTFYFIPMTWGFYLRSKRAFKKGYHIGLKKKIDRYDATIEKANKVLDYLEKKVTSNLEQGLDTKKIESEMADIKICVLQVQDQLVKLKYKHRRIM